MLVGVRTIALPLPTHVRLSGAVTVVPEVTHCKVLEKDMAPLILDIEEDEEDTDHHGDNDADHHHQASLCLAHREKTPRLEEGRVQERAGRGGR